MRRLISAVAVMWCLAAGTAWAQAFPPNEAGVTMGHWHLNTRDVEANKKIFVAMGGTALKAGNFEVVRFPGVIVYLHQAPGAPPPTGGTVGTVVNHVGFIVQNTQDVRFHFLFLDFTWPLWLYTIVVAVFGALVWFGLGVMRRHRRRKERREDRRD